MSTYYVAFPHSYIGIQPAKTPDRVHHEEMIAGNNHIALWAKSEREIDQFYGEFLLKEGVVVLDPPDWGPEYAPKYYAVFFSIRMGPDGNWRIVLLFRLRWRFTSGSNSLLRLDRSIRNGNTIQLSSVEESCREKPPS